MTALATFGAFLAAQIVAAATGAPDWAQTGILGAFATALYWQERKDRRTSEDRERTALVATADKLLDGLRTLDRAMDLIDAKLTNPPARGAAKR